MPDTPPVFEFLTLDPAPGVYGDEYIDEPRQGLDGHRFVLSGARGEAMTITGVLSTPTVEMADAIIDELINAMGSEIIVRHILRSRQWTVWLVRPRPGIPRAVTSTRAADNWRTDITLNIVTVA